MLRAKNNERVVEIVYTVQKYCIDYFGVVLQVGSPPGEGIRGERDGGRRWQPPP